MIIYINDKRVSLERPCTLQELLEQRERVAAHVAVALNNQFVPKSQFVHTVLQEGDRIDLIVPMQGG